MRLLVCILLLLGVAFGQRRTIDPREYIHNVLSNNQPILLKVWIQHGPSLVMSKDYELLYSSKQPEIADILTIPTYDLTENLTLSASLFKLPEMEQIAHEARSTLPYQLDLTRFQKIRKLDQDSLGGSSYDPIDQIVDTNKNETVSPAEYTMHVAVDFNLMFIHSETPFHRSHPIPPNMNFKRLPDRPNGESVYTVGIDLSQMHIPFRSYSPINASQHNVTLHIFPYDVIRYAAFYSLGHPQAMFKQMGPMAALMELGMDDSALDEMKEILFTNHVYLVAAYFLLSLSQTILRFFTIRQEYKFWKEIQNNRGVSLKTLFYELVFSAVLTLYVYQHNSSKLVIAFSLLDIGVTIWKISRTFSLKFGGGFPWIRLEASQLYRKRQKIDSQAVWYMNYLLVPLMAAYLWWALHSRNYSIRNWYTFLLETAVAFIAVFGFIMMTPQLYINYKLKSVEHLNWRGLIYRFINTLLDDLFAFMVTMPALRRLMYFRDDVIFLIYLYQRRIYRVDKTRRAPDSDPAPQVPLGAPTIPLKQE